MLHLQLVFASGLMLRALRGPRMQLDGGGAAIAIRDFDVWAGSSPLIEAVDWTIMPNERWSLLGENGAGKSTLLREIASVASGGEHPAAARQHVAVDPRLRLGMLEQTAVAGSEASVKAEVMSRMGAYQAARAALQAAEAACVEGSECELRRLDEAVASFEAAGGYDVDARVARVLKGLGFADDEFERPCSSFSGGWQMRVGLARLLLSGPDLLVMDEPTNHLDAAARKWLASYISDYAGTVLVVTHDEKFVSVACDSIAEVAGGKLQIFKQMPFSKYLIERERRRQAAVSTVDGLERERARLRAWIDRMGAKASKARQAKDRQGKLEKLEQSLTAASSMVVGQRRRPKLVLAPPPAVGAVPVALRDVDLAHPGGVGTVVRACSLSLRRGRRLILRGPNGAGKSTILGEVYIVSRRGLHSISARFTYGGAGRMA